MRRMPSAAGVVGSAGAAAVGSAGAAAVGSAGAAAVAGSAGAAVGALTAGADVAAAGGCAVPPPQATRIGTTSASSSNRARVLRGFQCLMGNLLLSIVSYQLSVVSYS